MNVRGSEFGSNDVFNASLDLNAHNILSYLHNTYTCILRLYGNIISAVQTGNPKSFTPRNISTYTAGKEENLHTI